MGDPQVCIYTYLYMAAPGLCEKIDYSTHTADDISLVRSKRKSK